MSRAQQRRQQQQEQLKRLEALMAESRVIANCILQQLQPWQLELEVDQPAVFKSIHNAISLAYTWLYERQISNRVDQLQFHVPGFIQDALRHVVSLHDQVNKQLPHGDYRRQTLAGICYRLSTGLRSLTGH